ncbi:response regulator [Novosphingobium sp. BL-8A]|uniref:response regulator n=1 Tax=Novosphingobium sp. BL-8A TaxID=3127639 RepID=UPI003757D20B
MQESAEVLVVDDVIAIVEELVTLLDLHGIGAHAATNLADGLSTLLSHPAITVIACDVRLAQESGLEIVSRIRDHPELRRRPFRFLFMSGDPMQFQHFPPTSAYRVLTKPIHPGRLMTAIGEMLDGDAAHGLRSGMASGV